VTPAVQLPLPEACPRCGRRVELDLVQAARMAREVEAGLNSIRLVVPDKLKAQVRLLAVTLPCLAGICSREAA